MEKQQLLQELQHHITAGSITHSEVHRLFHHTAEATNSDANSVTRYFTINNIFYLLGSIIVILGLVFFVAQLWNDIGSIGRILVTFGLGMLFAGLGTKLFTEARTRILGNAFHVFGAVLIPGGLFVTLEELDVNIGDPWLVTSVFAVLAAFYGGLGWIYRRDLLYFFTLVAITGFFYALTEALITGPFYTHLDVYAYLTMVIGASYLVLSDGMRQTWSRHLVGLLHGAGSLGILAAAFSQVMDSFFWELLFVPLLIAGIYWSTVTQSRSILAFSSLFVFIYVSYITSEYFADSLGWPISLVLLGFLFLGMGYLSLRLNREFIAK